MRFPYIVLAGLAAVVVAASSHAAAQDQPCDTPGVVSLAGEVILRIHAPAGGMDCQQRADKVQMRIVDALSIGIVKPADIHVKLVKKMAWRKDSLITLPPLRRSPRPIRSRGPPWGTTCGAVPNHTADAVWRELPNLDPCRLA